jgi:hypothetical protein
MEDILFEVLVWEQIEECWGKFMSAPVDAAIAGDTLVVSSCSLDRNKCARIVSQHPRVHLRCVCVSLR